MAATPYGANAMVSLLHPLLSENAASLLQEQCRPALLWTIDLDEAGETTAIDVRRARVRSCARLDYARMQAPVDAGHIEPMWDALRQVGQR